MTDKFKFDVAVVGGGISAVEAVRHFASFDNEERIIIFVIVVTLFSLIIFSKDENCVYFWQ